MFTDSLRVHLYPFEENDVKELWDALKEASLKILMKSCQTSGVGRLKNIGETSASMKDNFVSGSRFIEDKQNYHHEGSRDKYGL